MGKHNKDTPPEGGKGIPAGKGKKGWIGQPGGENSGRKTHGTKYGGVDKDGNVIPGDE